MTSRGYGLMADLVISLARTPATAKKLAVHFDGRIGIGPLRRLLRRLLDGGVLRISDWIGDRNAERVYAVGSEPSVPVPTKPRLNGTKPRPLRAPKTPARPMHFVSRFCLIWNALETPCAVSEICEEVDSTPSVIRPLVQQLQMARPKLVRIAGYEPGIQRTVIYERGNRPDASRPRRISEHESYLRAKQRRQAIEQHRAFSFLPQAA